MQLSIIIPTWNTAKITKECIKSIHKFLHHIDYEIILVDNASTDNTVSEIKRFKTKQNSSVVRKNHLKLKIIQNSKNLGFAKACNIGVKKAVGDCLIFLNSDMELVDSSLTRMVKFLQKNPQVGAIGPQFLNPDKTIQKSVFPPQTPLNAIKEFWFGQKSYSKYIPKNKKPVSVWAISGGAILIKKSLFKKIGKWNEKYFMYFEDLDLCRTLHRQNKKIYYYPQSQIIHHHGASGKNIKPPANQWKRLIPGSKMYHGLLKHNLITAIIWLSQKWRPLLFLFLASFFLHIYKINQLPPSLNWDEVSHGYNAYSILKTAKDEWGNFLPLIFRAYGDYKLPLYIYLTVPFVALLGPSTLAVRLPSIIAGALIPLLIYKISQKLTKNHPVAYLTALIATFSTWSIFLSRIALEANLFALFFLISLYFILNFKPALSSLFYALALFTYNSARVLLPFYLILLFVNFKSNKYPLKKKYYYFIPITVAIIIFIIQSLNPAGQARYQWVSLLDQGAINRINQLRSAYPRLLVNKVTYFIFTATKNYLSHFNPQFLFVNGSSHYQFNIPNHPLIYPVFLPLLILGLISSISHPIILLSFLIAVIPAAITRDAPHTLRSIVFLPLSTIIIGLGLNQIFIRKPKITGSILILVLLVSQLIFWPQYQKYTNQYSSSWQYGYKQVVEFTRQNYHNYDQIVFTKKYGEPHQFLLFFWPWDPNAYQNDPNKIWDYHANWYWVNAFDKFKFINDWEIKDFQPLPNTLLITSPQNHPSRGNLLKTVDFLDSTPAFDIIAYE